MAELFCNAGRARLNSAITNSATSITLRSGQGALFPNPGSGDYFRLVLEQGDPENPTAREIVYCTARSTDTLTITRGVEGTSGTAFRAGSRVEHRITAGMLESFRDILGFQRTRPISVHSSTGSTSSNGRRTGFGPLNSISGSATTPALATSSFRESTTRFDFGGTGALAMGPNGSSANSVVGIRGATVSSIPIGGFEVIARFGLANSPSDMRAIIGVKVGSANFALNSSTEPTGLTSIEFVGFGYTSSAGSSGFWSRYNCDGGGTVGSEVTNIQKNTTTLYQMRIWSFPGSPRILMELVDLITGARYSTTLTSNIPGDSQLHLSLSSYTTSTHTWSIAGFWLFNG